MSGLQRAVRQQVPAANNLPTNEVRAVITGWADARHVPLQDDGPRQRERVPDSALESLAMGAMSLASGVKIGHEEGLTEISVFGAQVGVGDEDLGVGASVAWEGKFGLFATYGGVRLTGEVSQESWRIGGETARLKPRPAAPQDRHSKLRPASRSGSNGTDFGTSAEREHRGQAGESTRLARGSRRGTGGGPALAGADVRSAARRRSA